MQPTNRKMYTEREVRDFGHIGFQECHFRATREMLKEPAFEYQSDLAIQDIVSPPHGRALSAQDFDDFKTRPRKYMEDLKEAIAAKDPSVPPICVIQNGDEYMIDEGHHRIACALAAGKMTLPAYVVNIERYPHLIEDWQHWKNQQELAADTGLSAIELRMQQVRGADHDVADDSDYSL